MKYFFASIIGFFVGVGFLHGAAPDLGQGMAVVAQQAEAWSADLPTEDVKIIRQMIGGIRQPAEDSRHRMSSVGFERIFRDARLLDEIKRKELVIENIVVDEMVDLSNMNINVPVLMRHCYFPKGIKMRNAHLVGIVMEACDLGFLEGDGATISNDVVVGPLTTIRAELRFPHSKIGGGISIREGTKIMDGPYRDCSINLWDAEVSGQFHIGGQGPQARISGCIVLNGALLGKMKIENSALSRCERVLGGFAILANWAKVRGSLDIVSGTVVEGPMNFQGVSIGGAVFIDELKMISVKDALNFENAKLETSMVLRRVVSDMDGAESALRLTRLQLKGDLEIEACTLRGSSTSLDADGVKIEGRVLLKNNDTLGEVRFEGARLSSDLIFQSGGYKKDQNAEKCLVLDGALVAGSINFSENTDDFRAVGVTMTGLVSMLGVSIGTDLLFHNANLGNAQLDLRQSTASRVVFPDAARPQALCMDGFTYKRISFVKDDYIHLSKQGIPDSEEKKVLTRFLEDESTSLLNLATLGNKSFEPQPYEQMASVMREMGHQKVAREILIEMSDSRMKYSDWQWGEWLWFRVFGRLIGYGHNPGRAFWLSIIWVSAAGGIFWVARKKGWIENVPGDHNSPVEEMARAGTEQNIPVLDDNRYWLNALPYAVEKFVPFLSLGIAEKWQNRALILGENNRGATFIHVFTWIHIVAGWVLASLWVGGLTGIAQ